MITRHFIDVGAEGSRRRVHYRRAGSGPAVLLVHQSPRSSLEYEPLMRRWAEHFTLFAPDTPGFGASDPLPVEHPEVADYADAAVAFIDALGLETVGAYGFHSGAITLIIAAKRHPGRFAAIAAVGYAVWTETEKASFADAYTPPFVPQPYGEHLAWLWSRVLEQTWFFPWYRAAPEARLSRPHDHPALAHQIVMEMLEAGDDYRRGYSAVLRADRDIPADGTAPPTLITAYDGDPLQPHLARLGTLPPNWQAIALPTPEEVEAACRTHLHRHPAPAPPPIDEAPDRGFVRVARGGFEGLLHYRGRRDAGVVALHAPGASAALIADADTLCLDLPGHGLSDDWPDGAEIMLDQWAGAVAEMLPDAPVQLVAHGWSALLALAVAAQAPQVKSVRVRDGHLPPPADAARFVDELTDITPDRFGSYLQRAWQAGRARQFFWPWFDASAANAIPFEPAAVAPEALRAAHLAAMQARGGRRLLGLLIGADRQALRRAVDVPVVWPLAAWARARADIWKPEGEA